ncbi:MAG: HIT family protein [Deltaproteobacteria bacterium]|nr:HIT family protein [Deltaproteobacteria bacterium]MBI3389833.1 HIT family protein [Deltaproteobacteria bacterium]
MATLFTKIINGELPGRFVWRDDRCVAFLSIRPLKPGHTLVVPIAEVDHWLDLEPALLQHLTSVAQSIGKAIQRGFNPLKVGVMLAGIEVPHVHFHLIPIEAVHDLDFANQDPNPNPADLDRAAETIRRELRALGFIEAAD